MKDIERQVKSKAEEFAADLEQYSSSSKAARRVWENGLPKVIYTNITNGTVLFYFKQYCDSIQPLPLLKNLIVLSLGDEITDTEIKSAIKYPEKKNGNSYLRQGCNKGSIIDRDFFAGALPIF